MEELLEELLPNNSTLTYLVQRKSDEKDIDEPPLPRSVSLKQLLADLPSGCQLVMGNALVKDQMASGSQNL
jgi:hypothetical protein